MQPESPSLIQTLMQTCGMLQPFLFSRAICKPGRFWHDYMTRNSCRVNDFLLMIKNFTKRVMWTAILLSIILGLFHTWHTCTDSFLVRVPFNKSLIPRSIDAFVPFKVVTRLIYWDERSLYFEQSFVSLHDGFVRAVALCKNTVVGGSVVQMLASLGVRHVPQMPKEVKI